MNTDRGRSDRSEAAIAAPLSGWRAAAIFGVKSVHSLAFWVIQSCIVYLLYAGLRRRSDRRAAIAAGIAIGESLIYAGNGFRCPLTGLAERLGSQHGQVTDIFLPRWLASNIARIYTPMLLLALFLHARNLVRGRRGHVLPRSRPGVSWARD